MYKKSLLSEADLEKRKNEVQNVLSDIGLGRVVSLGEIEESLACTEKIYESFLLLGVAIRCMIERSEKFEVLVQGFADWKNFLPRQDLGGLSPIEYEQQYPRGEHEIRIMGELLRAYQETLRNKTRGSEGGVFDMGKDFQAFQENFFSLIPLIQPFLDGARMRTHREIIMEERRRLGHQPEKLKDISIAIFAEDIAEKMEYEAARIEDIFITRVDELTTMQKGELPRSFKRVRAIFEDLIEIEPFMKCTKDAHRFYNNAANAAFLCGGDDLALQLLKKALIIQPDYELAKQAMQKIMQWKSSYRKVEE